MNALLHVAVANVGPHRFDLRKKLLLESATSCLTNSRRLLIFLHGHVGVIAVESFQRFSTDDLCNQVLNCRLGASSLIRTSCCDRLRSIMVMLVPTNK